MEKVNLTVLILTKNEENNIEKCLKSINNIAKRIVVIDSGSIDRTKEICEKYRVDFYYNEWVNHANQFNWGLKNVNITTEWVMRIDADEEILPKLKEEIKQKLPLVSEDVNGIILKRRVYFMGKWIKNGGMYPIKLLRIFRFNKAICENKEMDEHIILLEGKAIEFKNDFIDYNNKNLEWWINKHNWYSDKEVKNYFGIVEKKIKNNESNNFKRKIKEKGYYNLPLFIRAHSYFFYRYYIRLGFLDGNEGKIFHFLQAYWYRFLVDAKIYESQKVKK